MCDLLHNSIVTDMEPYTSMYYTFSTIAQVLAGFLALSSVFILSKIQWYSKIQLLNIKSFVNGREKEFECGTLSGYIFTTYMVKLNNVFEAGLPSESNYLFDKLLTDEAAKQQNPACVNKAEYFYDNINKLERNKQKLLKLTMMSLIIGVVTIIYSLIILSVVPSIIALNFRSIFLFLGITGAIVSLVIMTAAIIISLGDKTKHLTLEQLSSPR